MTRITNSTGVEHMATTADFTVADVLAWARTKPAGESYVYNDNVNCALCQFLRETRRAANPSVGSVTWTAWESYPYSGRVLTQGTFADEINTAAVSGNTFGSLVAQLEKLCPGMPITSENWAAIDAYLSDIEQVEQVPA